MPSVKECYESAKADIIVYNNRFGERIMDSFCVRWQEPGCEYHRACIYKSGTIDNVIAGRPRQICSFSDEEIFNSLAVIYLTGYGKIRIKAPTVYNTKW